MRRTVGLASDRSCSRPRAAAVRNRAVGDRPAETAHRHPEHPARQRVPGRQRRLRAPGTGQALHATARRRRVSRAGRHAGGQPADRQGVARPPAEVCSGRYQLVSDADPGNDREVVLPRCPLSVHAASVSPVRSARRCGSALRAPPASSTSLRRISRAAATIDHATRRRVPRRARPTTC